MPSPLVLRISHTEGRGCLARASRVIDHGETLHAACGIDNTARGARSCRSYGRSTAVAARHLVETSASASARRVAAPTVHDDCGEQGAAHRAAERRSEGRQRPPGPEEKTRLLAHSPSETAKGQLQCRACPDLLEWQRTVEQAATDCQCDACDRH